MTEHQIKAEQACPATHPLEGVGQLRNDFQGHSFPYKYTKYKCDQGRIQDFCRRVSSQPIQEGFAAPLDHSCKFNYKSIKF